MARHRRTRGRHVSGILLLDKPIGMTSNAALQEVKRLFFARKAGHTGSLDPLATGLLPVCFGEATKLSAFLLDADKHYQVSVRLGVRTTTGDAEGQVLECREPGAISATQLDEVLAEFTGIIEQVPPMHSAIKQNGQPLYKLAHQGIEIERQSRQVTVHRLVVRRFAGNVLDIDVHCSKGTYIRTLAEDIGQRLGCGAHVSALRRTAVAGFTGDRMVTLEQLRMLHEQGCAALDALLLPPDSALRQWPEVRLSDEVAYFLKKGQPVLVPRAPSRGWVRLYTGSEHFLGVGRILDDGRVAPKRLVGAAA